jgi:hypothetical protein
MNLNLEKYNFGVQSRIFLGHIMCKEGLLMNPQKIEAIQHANHPQNTKEFLSFLGIEFFCQQYIKDFAIRMEPPKHLLKRIGCFHWTTKCESTFR